MVVAALRMLRSSDVAGAPAPFPAAASTGAAAYPKGAASSVVVGFLTGLFGVGGRFLIIPALTLLLGLPLATAVATSLVIIVINSAAGFTTHLSDAPIDIGIAGAFTIAAILGSLAAGHLAPRLPGERLRRWFAYLVLTVAAYVIVQTDFNPGAVT